MITAFVYFEYVDSVLYFYKLILGKNLLVDKWRSHYKTKMSISYLHEAG